MRFDRTKFFAGYRAEFDPLTAAQVDGLEQFLGFLEADRHMTDVRWIAYALSTVLHECAGQWKPIREYGRGKGRAYGLSGFYGRGYVQLTWRDNYALMGRLLGANLVAEPDLALEPEVAYRILSLGMREGLFARDKTGRPHSLERYISGATCDYTGARRIINGTDKARLIAGYAEKFERILRASLVDSASPPPALGDEATGAGTPPLAPETETGGQPGADAGAGGTGLPAPADSTVIEHADEVNVGAAPAPDAPVKGTAAGDRSVEATKSLRLQIVGVVAAIWTAVSGKLDTVLGLPPEVLKVMLYVAGAVAVIAVLYEAIRQLSILWIRSDKNRFNVH